MSWEPSQSREDQSSVAVHLITVPLTQLNRVIKTQMSAEEYVRLEHTTSPLTGS